MAAPAGVVSKTGIAGLTLGGGVGWLARKYGLTCDTVVAFELVTADGEVLRASADDRADLFWALRATRLARSAIRVRPEHPHAVDGAG